MIFSIFFFRLVGGPPTTTAGRGPQAAAYLCLYVKTATVLISDHGAILYILLIGDRVNSKNRRWRFNIALLKNSDYISELNSKLADFILHYTDSASNQQSLWEVNKCFTQGNANSFSSCLHSSKNRTLTDLQIWISLIENRQKYAYCVSREKQLAALKKEYISATQHIAEFIIH